MDTIYGNIGSKLKGLAFLVNILGAIISIIWGVVIWSSRYGSFLEGLLTIVLGSLGSFIGSWGLYALGSATENLQIIADAVTGNPSSFSSPVIMPSRSDSSASMLHNATQQMESYLRPIAHSSDFWICKHCGYKNPNTLAFCKDCAQSK